MTAYSLVLALLSLIPSRASSDGKKTLLLTATFYSDHWLKTHLVPLGKASCFSRVIMVATTPVPEMDGVEAHYPPEKLRRVVGDVPARLATFTWLALKERPDYIGGFHLLLNGLLATVLAKMTRRRSIYFCGGGPREVAGGGNTTENRIFNRIDQPSAYIERRLIGAVKKIDLVITMGTGAIDYFKSKGVQTRFEIMPGGFDEENFYPPEEEQSPDFDLILIGRLSSVKRVDLLLDATAVLAEKHANIRIVVVGDGPDRESLTQKTNALGLGENVEFAGWQDNVGDWLRRSRLFTLTSDSEGLSQALIQAMMCGLPAVVSDVGDLGDLVRSDANGYLVQARNGQAFAECYEKILYDNERYAEFSAAAREHTAHLGVPAVTETWQKIFSGNML